RHEFVLIDPQARRIESFRRTDTGTGEVLNLPWVDAGTEGAQGLPGWTFASVLG
ncbi:MAG: hypothetical protein RLZZ373_3322, partial [Pseudomonadota bacterium]